ncbi:TetR/AcrR family transcriptional regulator [Phormidium tenue FACHB-886]|nr:TetR/AcrR family transcriptional regulator [Phormidium tenue FACHB-886]
MPKIVDHDLYRKELLHKSFNLFAEKGYATITMRQIAQGLGVSTGTLYHYFPSKEALFEQLMEEQAEQDISQVTVQLQQVDTLPDRVRIAFEYLEQNQEYHFKQSLLCIDYFQQRLQEGQTKSDVLERICEHVENLLAVLLGIHDRELIRFVMSYVDGLMFSQMYHDDSINFPRQAQILTDMLTVYLANHPA